VKAWSGSASPILRNVFPLSEVKCLSNNDSFNGCAFANTAPLGFVGGILGPRSWPGCLLKFTDKMMMRASGVRTARAGLSAVSSSAVDP